MRRILTCMVAVLLAGSVAAAWSSVLAQGKAQPPQGRFQLLPATPEPPEFTAQRQEAEQAMQGINQGRVPKQQLRQMLFNHPSPTIRAKAQQAARREVGTPLPATPEPPEVTAHRLDAENALKGINQGRLSPSQRRQMLLNHPNPSIREKAQEAQRVKLRSELDSQDLFAALSSLGAALNPWKATEAQAQGTSPLAIPLPPYAVTLTPQAPTSASATLHLYGVTNLTSSGSFMYALENGSNPNGYKVNYPFANVSVNVPRTGWYLIDFYGYGKPKTQLRKLILGNPSQMAILESWDLTTSPTPLNHLATVEYLAQGSHYFYLMIYTSVLVFYEVSVEEF